MNRGTIITMDKWSKIKDYFIQFMMLFLAIFLGAVGENYRQQYTDEVVERNMEKETLQAMVNDLKTDIDNLTISINNKNEKGIIAKNLINFIKDKNVSNHTKDIYYCARVMTTREPFFASDGAVTQLQYSGGYTMIKNKTIIDQINKYNYIKEKIYKLNETEEHILVQYRIAASKIFKADIFSNMLDAEKHKDYKFYIKPLENNVPLFSTNPAYINEFVFWVSSANGNQSSNKAEMTKLKNHAIQLIKSIQFHLKEA
jgi:hypothetical protein